MAPEGHQPGSSEIEAGAAIEATARKLPYVAGY
jgi:hypothetical protein